MERGTYTGRQAAIQRIDQWRASCGGHGRGSRIPEELWHEAVEMARVEGVWATSRTLRLNCSRLKARLDSAAPVIAVQVADTQVADNGEPTFVELGMSAMVGGAKTIVELVSRDGDRMHVEVAGEGLDLASLTRAFLGGRS